MPHTQIRQFQLRQRPGLWQRLVGTFKLASLRRRDRQRLSRLDAHLLRDIGLDPTRAAEECAKPFWRP